MAIKAGQILHAMNTFVVDRIQTAGPGNLNIPTERIYELGNYQSVAVVRDVPDLSFSLECLDVDTEVEALLVGSSNPDGDTFDSTKYSLDVTEPVDIISPWKSAQGAFDVVKSVAIPHLTLESASYRYGLRDNAGETFSLRGDSIFYVPGQAYNEVTTIDANQASGTNPITFANAAQQYQEGGVTRYALNVALNPASGAVKRLRQGTDYTETANDITLTASAGAANGDEIRITYGSSTVGSYAQSVHQGLGIKPAAIKGKDIEIWVSDGAATPTMVKWGDVQSVNVEYRTNLEADFEFGNPNAVARDYAGTPDVSGSIELKPLDPQALFDRIQTITGVPATDIVGPQSSVALPVEIRLKNPDSGGTSAQATGTVLKTLYVPDARFTIPGYDGRANQKLNTTLNFESDGGVLEVFKGSRF